MLYYSTKWATSLMSLNALVETGRGAPSPNDVEISNWQRPGPPEHNQFAGGAL